MCPPGKNTSATNSPISSGDQSRRPPSTWVAEVFARLEAPLVAYARRRLAGDLESARDVVQEAFVKLCQQAWPDIQPRVTAWLYKTCRNRTIDLIRREGRSKMSTSDVTTLRDAAQPLPGERVEHSEQLQRMRTHIEELPDQQQEVLRLRLQDGLSYQQIAEVTGLTASNVGYHLHQAVVNLRVCLRASAADI